MHAKATTLENNERVRVTKWWFEVGEETGLHRHELDYLVVPLISGTLTIMEPNGNETPNTISEGSPYFRYSGAEHNVINRSDSEIAFLEIEIK
ncbi:cupin [Chloroflexi bacterium]|nr:cupin [Chloroflexota bacterium]